MTESEKEAVAAIHRLGDKYWMANIILLLAGLIGYMLTSTPIFEAFSLFGFVLAVIGLAIFEWEVRHGSE